MYGWMCLDLGWGTLEIGVSKRKQATKERKKEREVGSIESRHDCIDDSTTLGTVL